MISYMDVMRIITTSDYVDVSESSAVIKTADKEVIINWSDYTSNQIDMIKKWIELTNSYDGEYNSIDRMIRVI